ncbi:OLC1v1029093C1 [Oldenlandia corymbosa var. corymbosa]|uniref:OLC1v1029093C1 n=1 Tax=Oldenlandia corymbosa var. corymbosa TaxID=529605 RepID=A0AAV1CDL8_OLDCO|nr:OLC1v1029093C1 [Oldenlandia corymbosa var. corymbosa]
MAAYIVLLFISFLLVLNPVPVKPNGLVLPIQKDQSTKYTQYITRIYQRTPLVPVKLTLDLGGENLWVDCDQRLYYSSSYKAAHCGSKVCSTYSGGGCRDCYVGPQPGCNNNTCTTAIRNRITDHLTGEELAQDLLALQSNNGSSKAGHLVTSAGFVFACGEASILEGTPENVNGFAGFGRGKLGLPSLLSKGFRLPNKFALCLSNSTRSTGVLYFGDKPYMTNPNRDISVYLLYTPLLIKPFSIPGVHFKDDFSSDYWIQVKSIKISGKEVPINATLLTIDKEGYGGTKISTIHPYTVMETSIYRAFKKAFIKELAHIPRVKAVAPFEVCYSSKSLPYTQVGPSAPFIDLGLHHESVWWRIYGENSMVKVSKDVLCLGFVDGGENREVGMVIGAHQIQNNLLQFDLESNRLGFTSLLFLQQTSCANFNFKG